MWAFETKKSSDTWNEYFETVHRKHGTAHLLCKHCHTVFPHPNSDPNKSTSSIGKHLKTCSEYKRKLRNAAGEDSPSVDLFEDFFNSVAPRDRPVTTRDRVKEKVLRIIISGNLSFSFAENDEFVDLLKDAYPDCTPPNRRAIVEYLKSKATLTRHELKAKLGELDSKVSIALDIWTTRTNLAFLGMSSPGCQFWFSSREIKSHSGKSFFSCHVADQFSNYGSLD
jgi:hypothetical protein